MFEQIYSAARAHLWGTNRCGGDKRRESVRHTHTHTQTHREKVSFGNRPSAKHKPN